MALLATLDIEDAASPKAKGVVSAIDDVGTALTRTAERASYAAREQAKAAREMAELAKNYETAARKASQLQQSVANRDLSQTGATAKEAQGLRELEAALVRLGTPTATKALENLKALGPLSRSWTAGVNNQKAYAAALGEASAALMKEATAADVNSVALKKNAEAAKLAAAQAKQHAAAHQIVQKALQAAQQGPQNAAQANRLVNVLQNAQGYAQTAQQAQQLASALNQAQQAQQGFAQQAPSTTAQLAAMTAALAAMTAGLGSYLKGAVDLAARNEVLGTVTEVVAKNAGIATGNIAGQIGVTKSLGITTQAATDAVIDFAQAQLDVSKTSQLARVAQDLGVVAGKNSSETFQILTKVIQTQQTEMLRQFGIVKNMGVVMREYGATVGKTAKELTGLDRQQAVLNLILTEGARATGAYEKSMEDAGKKATSLARYQEELAAKIGKELLPVYEAWIDMQTAAYKVLMSMPPEVTRLVAVLATLVTVITGVAAAMKGAAFLGMGSMLTSLAGSFGLVGTAAGGTAAVLSGPVILAIGAVIIAVTALIVLWDRYHTTTSEQVEADAKAADKMATHAVEVENLTSKIELLNGIYAKTPGQVKALADAQAELNQELVNSGMSEAAVQALSYEEKVRAVTKAVQDQAQAQVDAAKTTLESVNAQIQAQELLLQALNKNGPTLGQRANGAMAGMAGGLAGMAYGAYNAAGVNKAMIEAETKRLKGLAEEAQKTVEKMQGFTVAGRREAAAAAKNEAEAVVTSNANALRSGMKDFNDVVEYVKANGSKSQKLVVDEYRKFQKEHATLDNTPEGKRLYTQISGSEKYKQAVEAVGTTFSTIIQEQEAKAEKLSAAAVKAFENAKKKIDEALNKLATPEVRGKLTAIDAALGTGDPEKKKQVLQLFGAELLQLGTAAELTKAGFKNAGKAVDELMQRSLDQWANKNSDALEDLQESLSASLQSWQQGIGDARIEADHAANLEMIESRREAAEEIRQIDEALYEDQALAFMTTQERIRYEGAKQIADLQRAQAERTRMGQLALDEEKRAADVKYLLAKRELTQRAEIEKQKLELTRQRVIRELEIELQTASGPAAQILQQRIAGLNQFYSESQALQDQDLQLRLQAMEEDKAATDDLLRHKQGTFDQITAAQEAATDRQVASVQRGTALQLKAMTGLTRFAETIWNGIADGVANAMGQMLTGVKGWRDALMDVWNSVLSAFQNMLSNMVKEWFSKVGQMAFSGGQGSAGGATGSFSWGGMLQGMFGRGGQGGGSAMQMAGAAGMMGGTGMIANRAGTGSNTWMAASGMSGKGAAGAAGGTTMAGVMGSGAAGGIVGGAIAARYADGSYVKGIGAGAAGGAAAGAAYGSVMPGIGTALGAGVGAIAGGLAGWWQARKQRKQMNEDREAIIEQAGGIEALKAKAEEAGISIDKMLATKSVKEFQKEIQKMDAGFTKLEKDQLIAAQGGSEMFLEMARSAGTFDEATLKAFANGTLSADKMGSMLEKIKKDLELKEAKDGLAKTTSQMDALRKSAVLAGYDLKKLYDAKSIEEFNAQQAGFNKLLEQQQGRLEGLGTAASGFGLRVTGLVQEYGKDLETFTKGLSSEQQKAWKDLAEKSAKDGKTLVQQLREASSLSTGLSGGSRVGDLSLSGKQGDELSRILNNVQAGVSSLGGQASRVFGGILRETGDLGSAFAAINEPLDMLQELLNETGAEAPEALNRLLSFRQAVNVNKDVANSLGGITMMLKGLGDAGQLTADAFNELGSDAGGQWAKLKERGVAEDQALLMIQPTLQALYEAQKNFGHATNETTQSLINMGMEQGLVGDQFQDINSKMLDMLMIIAEAVGGTVPEAYRKQAAAATDAAAAQQAAAQATAAEQARLATETARVGEAARDASGELSGIGGDGAADMALQMQVAAQELENVQEQVRIARDELAELAGVDVGTLMSRLGDIKSKVGDAETAASEAKDSLQEIDQQRLDAIMNALGGTEDHAYRIENGAAAATSAIIAMVNDTRGPLAEMEANVAAISLGRSPGGLKEIAIKSAEGIAAMRALRDSVNADAMSMEGTINRYVATLGTATDIDPATANPLAGAVAPPASAPPPTAQPTEGAASESMVINVTMPPVSANIQTLDPSKMSDVWTTQIRPLLAKDFENNAGQFATQLAKATTRFTGGGGLRRGRR
jgi:hypothetical protein